MVLLGVRSGVMCHLCGCLLYEGSGLRVQGCWGALASRPRRGPCS